VFTSSGIEHGGQESTILSFHVAVLHHGQVIVGVRYSEKRLMGVDVVSGGSAYGSSTIPGPEDSRIPSANEIVIARFQGKHVAGMAAKLSS